MQGGEYNGYQYDFSNGFRRKSADERNLQSAGMTTSTAFNIFANAFVRAKGMPFAVTVTEETVKIPREKMLADTDQLLAEFASDYKRMAE